MQFKPFTCRIGEKLLCIDRPQLMGIINISKDSFYQRGDLEQALALAERHISEGADMLDIGACSTRPGAQLVSEQEEIDRLIPCLEALRKKYPECILSVDTFRAKVVKEAERSIGAFIVNDVSGGKWGENLFELTANLSLPYILTHSQGLPENMQSECTYEDLMDQMMDFFQKNLRTLRHLGVNDVWIDPGFGFGKTLEQNYEILANLRNFEVLNCPILVGLSRKSMLYKALDKGPEDMLNATGVAHGFALTEGAHILRVHDVGAAKETIRISTLYQQHKH